MAILSYILTIVMSSATNNITRGSKIQRLDSLLIFMCVQVSRNIVMEAHLIRPTHFTGITCTVYQRRDVRTGSLGMEAAESTHEQQLRFRCSTGIHNTSLNYFPLKVRCFGTLWQVSCTTLVYFNILNLCLSFDFFLLLSPEFSRCGLCDSPRLSVSSRCSCRL